MKNVILVGTTLILLAGLQSCVSTKKFDALAYEKRQLEKEKLEMQQVIAANNQLISDLEEKAVQLTNTEDDLARTKSQFEALQTAHKDMQDKYDELIQQSESILHSSSEEKAALSEELSSKQSELDHKEKELRLMEMRLNSQQENLATLQEDVRIRERKLLELTRSLHEKDSLMQTIRSKVNEALRGFSASDLTITERNGKVYVSLSQNLLFAKGSNVIDQAGRSAIRKLAAVLKSHPDIRINVEGHTDSDGSEARNWDLSVTRATTVVKELSSSGLDGYQITASGRSFFDPKVQNDTESNKSINRRTEIILSPDLDALYDLINS
ncbi:MAG: OmpA family protein [Saprospiraceae bacterium]|nr:OmpA family protein [Saprospiraceae bacterium]